MKCLISVLATVVLAVAVTQAAPGTRQKRFAGFGSFSTVGGRVGCVVSENGPGNASLFVNSHFSKFLSADEIAELDQYKKDLANFKSEVKTFLEQRQKQALSGQRPSFGADSDSRSLQQPQQQQLAGGKQPEPPKKPSFCSEKATTQYVFDGCSVQGDNVYIGDNFVRKLSDSEQQELAEFDKKFTAYQKAVTHSFKQQVEDIFGKHFGSLFDAGSSANRSREGGSSTAGSGSVESVGATSAPAASAAPPSEPPKTPNFCTLIV